ncbi:MAG TPA: bifunctional diguanylate cyclase/phosphodiesterase [Acidimicrobiales bacterium]
MSTQLGARPRWVASRLWVIVGVFGLLWATLHGLGVLDASGSLTKVLGAVIAVVATVIGMRLWRPTPVWPWRTVLAALGLFAVELGLKLVLDSGGGEGSIIPDLLALPAYILLAVGVAGVAGVGRGERDDVDAVLDAVITALTVLSVVWVFVVVPFLDRGGSSTTFEILLVAYPVGSLVVFAMGARLMFGKGRRTAPAMLLCLLAIFALLVGDVAYAITDGGIFEVPSSLQNVPYFLALVGYAVAVLHPTMAQIGVRRPSDEMAPTRTRLLAVALALCVSNVVLFIGVGWGDAVNRVALGVITTLLVAAAVLRMTRALREHAASQTRLAYQATHDALTGMPNRTFLAEQLQRLLIGQQATDGAVSFLHVNIDRFGLVNDTMGHSVGDELLKAVSRRLLENVRGSDVVGRIGGDEFGIAVPGLADEDRAHDFGERARLLFHTPFRVDGTEVMVTASVGVAHQAARVGDAGLLLRDADTAVSNAKALGGDHAILCDDSMRQAVAGRLHLERELRHALERGELSLHYQPKVELGEERAVGVEALLRWTHPEMGMVRPDTFIPIAEDTGMIVEIGAWALDRACADVARLRDEYSITSLRVSVNVSARQLRSDSLVDTAARALVEHRVPASALCIELTESVLMENLDAVSTQLKMLRAHGTQVSIDDFGTGYSSLAYLSSLPVDELKIDRTFVQVLDDDPHAVDVIGAVVTLANALNIRTVAEGTETRDEVDRLKALGCDEAQGFFFARPVPFEELAATLTRIGLAVRPALRAVPERPLSARTIA